ncbi:MAG: hypothetical protein QJR00_04100 [Bacillota bacterium]|nr:hypothetical protein [Bacillota bacterium]
MGRGAFPLVQRWLAALFFLGLLSGLPLLILQPGERPLSLRLLHLALGLLPLFLVFPLWKDHARGHKGPFRHTGLWILGLGALALLTGLPLFWFPGSLFLQTAHILMAALLLGALLLHLLLYWGNLSG